MRVSAVTKKRNGLESKHWVAMGERDDAVQITLPDALAEQAERAGLLAPERVEKWPRNELKSKAWDQLSSIVERTDEMSDPAAMSPEEVAFEIKKMRAEKRANQGA
jgi:hypothetical protein